MHVPTLTFRRFPLRLLLLSFIFYLLYSVGYSNYPPGGPPIGRVECLKCASGFYGDAEGQASPYVQGYTGPAPICKSCTPGSYVAVADTDQTKCKLCPVGYTNIHDPTAKIECQKCVSLPADPLLMPSKDKLDVHV